MLKTCLLPTNYTYITNKTCGEIICQSETSFTIVCSLCKLKIFYYDEFIEHFRSKHWPEIANNKTNIKEQDPIEEALDTYEDNEIHKIIKTEQGATQIEKPCETNEKHFSSDEDEFLVECRKTNETSDEDNEKEHLNSDQDKNSDDSTKPLAILKKKSKKSSDNKKDKQFECDSCNRKFTTKFYLRFHIKQQHEPKEFACDKCDKTFVEQRYLKLHQRSHTGYSCKICQQMFEKYEALRYHEESHIETRNFICDVENCGKAFPNSRRLSAHRRSHFVQPSYVCEICGSRQRSKEYLTVHIRTHTGEKPYACKLCDRRFAAKHFLQDHQAVHATEKSHVCTVCSKAFASSKSLYHHRHLHSGVKKYVCKICNSAYSQAAGLSAHMRKHKQDSGLLDHDHTVNDNNLFF